MIAESKQKKTLRIIFDSNVFFVSLRFKIDIFEELKSLLGMNFEPILLLPIHRELEVLTEKGSLKHRKNARYALQLAEKCKLVEVEGHLDSPDDLIMKVAEGWNAPVFTNDKQLREKLRNINVPVIYVRQKARLEMDGRIQSLV